MDSTIDRMRALSASDRLALHALASGAQLVLLDSRWQGYAEERGKVRPLGVTLTDAALKALLFKVPDGPVVIPTDPTFVYLPAEHRLLWQDLLTLSMPTQHLVREEPQERPRERHAA
jgi:hypothetical protein